MGILWSGDWPEYMQKMCVTGEFLNTAGYCNSLLLKSAKNHIYVVLYLAFSSLSSLFTSNYLLNLFKVAQNQVLICCTKLLDSHLSQVKYQDPFTPHLIWQKFKVKQNHPIIFYSKNNS